MAPVDDAANGAVASDLAPPPRSAHVQMLSRAERVTERGGGVASPSPAAPLSARSVSAHPPLCQIQNKIPISTLYEVYVDGDVAFKGDVLVREPAPSRAARAAPAAARAFRPRAAPR